MPEVRKLPQELTQTIPVADTKTGTGTQDFLQSYNALIRYLRELNDRVSDLE
jgi:hypothetical protein